MDWSVVKSGSLTVHLSLPVTILDQPMTIISEFPVTVDAGNSNPVTIQQKIPFSMTVSNIPNTNQATLSGNLSVSIPVSFFIDASGNTLIAEVESSKKLEASSDGSVTLLAFTKKDNKGNYEIFERDYPEINDSAVSVINTDFGLPVTNNISLSDNFSNSVSIYLKKFGTSPLSINGEEKTDYSFAPIISENGLASALQNGNFTFAQKVIFGKLADPKIPDWFIYVDSSRDRSGDGVTEGFAHLDDLEGKNGEKGILDPQENKNTDHQVQYLKDANYLYAILIIHNKNPKVVIPAGSELYIQGPVTMSLFMKSNNLSKSKNPPFVTLNQPLTIIYRTESGETIPIPYNNPVTMSFNKNKAPALGFLGQDYYQGAMSGIISYSIPIVSNPLLPSPTPQPTPLRISAPCTFSYEGPLMIAFSGGASILEQVVPSTQSFEMPVSLSGSICVPFTDALPLTMSSFAPEPVTNVDMDYPTPPPTPTMTWTSTPTGQIPVTATVTPAVQKTQTAATTPKVSGNWKPNFVEMSPEISKSKSGEQSASTTSGATTPTGSNTGSGKGGPNSGGGNQGGNSTGPSTGGGGGGGSGGSIDPTQDIYIDVFSLPRYQNTFQNLFASVAGTLGGKSLSGSGNPTTPSDQQLMLTPIPLDVNGDYYMAVTLINLNPDSLNRMTVHFPNKMVLVNQFPDSVGTDIVTMDGTIIGASIALGCSLLPSDSLSSFISNFFPNFQAFQADILLHCYFEPQKPFRNSFNIHSANIFLATPIAGTKSDTLQALYLGLGMSDFWDQNVGIDIGYGWDWSAGGGGIPGLFCDFFDLRVL